MKPAYRRFALPVILISALAACDRDNASETAQAPGAPLPASEPLTTESTIAPPPPAGGPDVAAGAQGSTTAAGTDASPAATPDGTSASNTTSGPSTANVASTSPEHTKAMEQLNAAAQRLRDATQEMARQPGGERRNQAIREANQALLDTQEAMMRLPPELRTKGADAAEPSASTGATASTGSAGARASAGAAGTGASAGAGGTTASAGTPAGGSSAAVQGAGSQGYFGTTTSSGASGVSGGSSTAQYDAANARVMEKLLGASQQLREALQALAQQPASTARDQSMKEARQALYDTQQAMIRLPTVAPTQSSNAAPR